MKDDKIRAEVKLGADLQADGCYVETEINSKIIRTGYIDGNGYLTKPEAELIAERINKPNKVIEIIEGMKKEYETKRNGYELPLNKMSMNERMNACDEVLKRISKL